LSVFCPARPPKLGREGGKNFKTPQTQVFSN
jgi:hypothetical protein